MVFSLDTLNSFSGSLPKIALSTLRQWYTSADGTDGLGLPLKLGGLRLFDLLGYGFSSVRNIDDKNYPDSYKNGSTTQASPSLNPFRFLAYQKIYQDFYRIS